MRSWREARSLIRIPLHSGSMQRVRSSNRPLLSSAMHPRTSSKVLVVTTGTCLCSRTSASTNGPEYSSRQNPSIRGTIRSSPGSTPGCSMGHWVPAPMHITALLVQSTALLIRVSFNSVRRLISNRSYRHRFKTLTHCGEPDSWLASCAGGHTTNLPPKLRRPTLGTNSRPARPLLPACPGYLAASSCTLDPGANQTVEFHLKSRDLNGVSDTGDIFAEQSKVHGLDCWRSVRF